jgi:hypothetical protein
MERSSYPRAIGDVYHVRSVTFQARSRRAFGDTNL